MSREVASATATETLSVLIVDDHALIAQGVAVALEAENVRVEITTGPSSEDVLEIAERLRPDVVLLDLQLEGQIGSGLPLIRPLRDLGAAVLVVTGVTDRMEHAACLEEGAVGIASKSEPFDELVAKVLRAADDEPAITPADRFAMLDELQEYRSRQRERLEPFERLTPKESAVLRELMNGLQAEAIAERHYVSIATVRSQIRAILQKLEVNSQLAAVALARTVEWAHSEANTSIDR